MKYSPVFLFLIMVSLALLCSCRKDDETGNYIKDPAITTQILLTQMVFTNQGDTLETAKYIYDNANQLLKYEHYNTGSGSETFAQFTYNNDGSVNTVLNESGQENYYYKNGKLDKTIHSYIYKWQTVNDTIQFYFGSNGRVSREVSRLRMYIEDETYTYGNKTTDFVYFGNNLLKMKTNKEESQGRLSIDTAKYEWDTKANLVKIEYCDPYSFLKDTYTYSYDSKPNYYKAIPYPKEYVITQGYLYSTFRSANNCIHIEESSGGTTLPQSILITEYNKWGFPVKLIPGYGSMELFYKEL